ncbi:MAG: hypothetical protein [Bacteriophage sp.]|nr:MAG: hypothetical protein [Bacteriophage sp.]
MAKKTENYNFDDFDFNFDDANAGGYNTKKKTSAARKAITEFGGELVSGLKNSFLSPVNQRNFLEKNLPKGFTSTFDAVSLGAQGINEVYSAARDETSKQFQEMSGDLAKLNKAYGDKLPKGLAEKIGEKLSQFDRPPQISEETEFTNSLDAVAAQFDATAKTAAVGQIEANGKQTDKVVAGNLGTITSLNVTNRILSNISANSDRMFAYKQKVDSVIQRKQIELIFKQYTIQRQQLDVAQQTLALQKNAFEAIIKNTGLPETVKATNWEMTTRAFKTKLVGSATERAASYFSPVFRRMIDQLKKNAKDNIGQAGGMMQMMLMPLVMQAEMGDMDGFGPTRYGMAGSAAGAGLGWLMQNRLGKKFGEKLRTNKTTNKYGNMMQNFMDTFPGRFNQMQNNGSGFSKLMGMLGLWDIMAEDNAKRKYVRGSPIDHLDEATAFNKQSQMALTEVIPGFLSKIHHELEVMRTGKNDLSPHRFDWDKGVFSREAGIAGDIRNKTFGKSKLRDVRKEAHETLKQLDSKNQLSPKAKKALLKYIMQQASSDVGFIDPRALMSTDSPIANIDHAAADEIAEVLGNEHNFKYSERIGDNYGSWRDSSILKGNLVNDANYQQRMANANSSLKGLRSTMPMTRNSTLKQAQVGNIDVLRDLGLVKWNKDTRAWEYDESVYTNAVLGGGIPKYPNGNGPSGGGTPPRNPFNPVGGGQPPTPPGGGGRGSGGGITNHDDDGLVYSPFQRELLETIERTSSRLSVDAGNQVLEAIRQRIEAGIPQSDAQPGTPNDQNRKANWFKKLLGGAVTAGGKGIRGYFRFGSRLTQNVMKNFIQRPFQMVRGVVDLPSKLFSGPHFKSVNDLLTAGKDSIADLYIKGKDGVALKKEDLLAGKYFDQKTKKVIKKFSDIKGAIVDADGNVVISVEDAKDKLYTLIQGKPYSLVGGILKAGLSAVMGAVKLNASLFTGGGLMANRAVSAIVKTGKWLLAAAQDVYVSGETSPRLLASIMQAGGYVNRQGKVIKSVFDIDGDVLDRAGNVVLSVADIGKGLLDKAGKRFKSLSDKIRGIAKIPLHMASAYFNGVKRVMTTPLRFMRNLFKGHGRTKKLSGKETANEVQVHIASSVDRIYDLLNSRLPNSTKRWDDKDGSGFRDGSREDYLSRAKKAMGNVASAVKDKAEKKSSGLLGILMTLVGGVGGILGAIKGWMKNIFSLTGLFSKGKMLSSVLGMASSVAGAGGAAGAAGKASWLKRGFMGTKNFLFKSKWGKAALGAAALFGLSRMSHASTSEGFLNHAGGLEEQAAMQDGRSMMGGAAGDPTQANNPANGGVHKSYWDRMKTAVTGSVIGQAGSLATIPLALWALNKHRASKGLHPLNHTKAPPVNASWLKRAAHGLTATTKGQLLLAGLTGAGLFAGKQMLGYGQQAGMDLGHDSLSSYGTSLGLDAAAIAAPFAIAKLRAMHAAKAAQKLPQFTHVASPAAKAPFTRGFGSVGQAMAAGASPVAHAAAAAAPVASKLSLKGGLATAGKLGKGLFKQAGWLGTALAINDAYQTKGNAWDKTKAFGSSMAQGILMNKAIDVGGKLITSAGRQSLMTGGRAALTTAGQFLGRQGLMTAGRTALTSLAGMVSAPVLIGAGVIAAVGIGAWLGYKYFFKTDKNAVVRFRMAQYGVKLSDKEKATMVGQLEALCQKSVTFTKDGKAQISSRVSTAEIMRIFGLHEDDRERVQDFIAWFTGRFKPVFLNALGAYKGATGKTDMEKADTLDKKVKTKIVNAMAAVTGKPDPYSVMNSPFPDGKKLSFDRGDVQSELKDALRNIGHEKDAPGKKPETKAKDDSGSIGNKIRSRAEVLGNTLKEAGKDFLKTQWDISKSAFNNVMSGNFIAAGKDIVAGIGNLGKAINTTGVAIGNAITGGGVGFYKGTGGSVASIPNATGKGWNAVKATLLAAAKMVGVDPSIMVAIPAVESGYDPSIKAKGSSAAGLFQFVSGTWNAMIGKYGKVYGIPAGTSPLDARANAVLGACYIRENAELIKKIKGSVNATDIYMAHFLGGGGVKTFLQAMHQNPNISAASILPAAAKANSSIFFNAGKPRTVGEVYALMQNKLATKAKQFGVDAQYLGGLANAGSGATGGTAGVAAGGNNNAGANTGGATGGATGAPAQPTGLAATAAANGGWGGKYMRGTSQMEGVGVSAVAGNAFGAGDLKGMAKTGDVSVSGDAGPFIKTLDPNLIALGKRITRVADAGVDINGMVKGFMICFYAMVGEAAQKGVLKSVLINSANRSMEKQKALYTQYLTKGSPLAAKPGSSNHNFGIAIDINSANANTLAAAGLLDKYHFHRPLANHPSHPEPWHLENHLFARGAKNTQKEVAKSVKDAADPNKVKKAHTDVGKDSPVVKAEKQTANSRAANQAVMGTSMAFSGAGSNRVSFNVGGGSLGVGEPAQDNTPKRVGDVLNNFVSPSVNKPIVEQTQKRHNEQQKAHAENMLDVMGEQLSVQKQILSVLTDIRDQKGSTNTANSTEATAEQTAKGSLLASKLKGKLGGVPVSMSFDKQ